MRIIDCPLPEEVEAEVTLLVDSYLSFACVGVGAILEPVMLEETVFLGILLVFPLLLSLEVEGGLRAAGTEEKSSYPRLAVVGMSITPDAVFNYLFCSAIF